MIALSTVGENTEERMKEGLTRGHLGIGTKPYVAQHVARKKAFLLPTSYLTCLGHRVPKYKLKCYSFVGPNLE